MDNPSEVIAGLSARLAALEERVSQLEHPPQPHLDPSFAPPVPPPLPVTTPAVATPAFSHAGGELTTLGKAVLGIAGAYLLRALAETGTFPQLIIAILAMAYAAIWIAAAARAPASNVFARIVYSLTSALILAPMLWELTLRFHVLSPTASAAILVAFAGVALALTWNSFNAPVFWIAFATATLNALALMVATQSLPPFLVALLVIAIGSELATHHHRALNGRVLAAAAVDLATVSLLYIYSLDPTSRSGYANLSDPWLITLASAAFIVYLASIAINKALEPRRLSTFELVQSTLTLIFAIYGSTRFGADQHSLAIGAGYIALASVLYALGFANLKRSSVSRNFDAYLTWGAATFIMGAILTLPPAWLASTLAVAAIASTIVGIRRFHWVFEAHGALFLLAAAYVAGLLGFDHRLLLDSQVSAPSWIMATTFIGSLLCYGVTVSDPLNTPRRQLSHLVLAAISAPTAAAFFVFFLTWTVATISHLRHSPNMQPLTMLQTASLCALAVALAAAGSRLHRQELTWLAYTTVILSTAKIVLVDVRRETLLAISVTFLLLAATLILLPRIVGHSGKETSELQKNPSTTP